MTNTPDQNQPPSYPQFPPAPPQAPPGYTPYAQPVQPIYVANPYVVQQQKTGMAVASLVLGICAVFFGWLYVVCPVLAVIFGAVSLNKIKRDPVRYGGRGMAIAGLVLGIVFTAIYGLIFLAVLGS